mmetsp:Transcript_23002/g.38863  ORF Transcript_23002/g.38863 Transcript_23002/m.38863 type:complete len:221 (+) Transcript_23002:10095-10757(+)
MLFFELFGQIVHDAHVKVFATQEGVAVGRFDFEQAIVDFQDGHVECTTAKVINRDGLRVFLVQTVGQGRRCGFVDDPQHLKTGDFARVLGRLTLGVVEIGWDGDDRLCHVFAKIAFGGFFHFAQDKGADLAGRILFVARLDPCVAVAAVDHGERHVFQVFGQSRVIATATNQALYTKNCVFWVGNCLALGRLAYQALVISESDDGRRGARAFGVFNHFWL